MSAKRKFTRREFLKTASIAAAGATLAACAPAATQTTVPAATQAQPTAAKALKTLRYAMSGKVSSKDTADPAFGTSQHDGRLTSAVYDQLAQFDESLKAQPMLAESWSANDKADVWTFKLRQGVTFHDGSKFTSKDVVYTFKRLIDPATASPGAGNLTMLDPDGIKAVDDYTVEFKLKQANVDLPLALITRQTWIVKDGASSDNLKLNGMGTGPFKQKEFKPGETPSIYEKNPNYWQAGLPKVDVLELLSISEPASRVAALQSGQVDVMEDPPTPDLDKLKAGPDTQLVAQPKGNMEVIAMHVDTPPFDDVRVRQAMKYAMDRQKMLQLVAGGYGMLVNDIPISPILEYALTDEPRKQDIAKAKQLLKEAGQENLTVKLAVSDVQARFVEIATVYKEQAAEADINVELDVRPADSYWDVVWLKEPFYVSAYIARPTDAMLALLYLSKADWNETNWRKPEWDKLLTDARGTLDYDKRKSLYQQAQNQLVEEGGHLVPYMVQTLAATRTNVADWTPSGTFYANFLTIDFTS